MTSNLTIRVSEELKSAFIRKAKQNDTTATALFQQWMQEYLDDDQPSTNCTNSTSATSTNDALTARLEQIENDLWNKDNQLQEMKEGFYGLTCQLVEMEDEHQPKLKDDNAVKIYAQQTEDSVFQTTEVEAEDGTLEHFEVQQTDLPQGLSKINSQLNQHEYENTSKTIEGLKSMADHLGIEKRY